MPNLKAPPVFLNLLQIRMPMTALISILHRVSGLLLLFFIPVIIYVLDLSLKNEAEFNKLKLIFESASGQLISVGLFWLLLHHLLSGLRFLLIDIDIGVAKKYAKGSAWVVTISAILLTLLVTGVQF